MAITRYPHKYNVLSKIIGNVNPIYAKYKVKGKNKYDYINSPFAGSDGKFTGVAIDRLKIPKLIAALGAAGIAYKYGPRIVKSIKNKINSKNKSIK